MMRTSRTFDTSGRRTIQSPPGRTVPFSFGPSKVPRDTGTITRLTPIEPMLLAGCVSRIRSINNSDCSRSSAEDCAPAPTEPAAAQHKDVNARREMSYIRAPDSEPEPRTPNPEPGTNPEPRTPNP